MTKTEEKIEKIRAWAVAQEWRRDNYGRFYMNDSDGIPNRNRLLFDSRSLRLQAKVPLTESEKEITPLLSMKWIDIRSASYSNVEISRGKLRFKTNKKKGDK